MSIIIKSMNDVPVTTLTPTGEDRVTGYQAFYVRDADNRGLVWSEKPGHAKKFDTEQDARVWLKTLKWGKPDDPNAINGHSGLGLRFVNGV
jgi:hypothetical protein